MNATKTLIIDGNNMAHRARHTFQLSYRCKDVSVTYGVMRMLQSLIRKQKPHSVIMTWDGGTPLYRRELVPSYKANRDRTKDTSYDEFVLQLEELQEGLPMFGIMSMRRRGIEADDLMYHASRIVDADEVVIVTTDDDLLQAVNEQVSILRPKKQDVLVTLENFSEVVGVHPGSYLRYKVLQGDGSDNIPGIVGVGPKTALKIIHGEKIQDKISIRLKQFISSEKHFDSLKCMTLQHDMCGARQVIIDVDYTRYNGKSAKNWCMDRGFVSLFDSEPLGVTFGRLRKPLIEPDDNMKFPVIWSYHRG